jgi:hypothetical protein
MSDAMSEATNDSTDVATAQVDAALARAGLPVSARERERLIRIYPLLAEWTAEVRIAETRYAEPALIYPATFDR